MRKLIEICLILSRDADRVVWAGENLLWLEGPKPDELSSADKARLKELGCAWHGQMQRWVVLTWTW